MQTKTVKICDIRDSDAVASLKEAAEIIKNGGLVVFPTETVYGLGADGTSPNAAKSIYAAKGRPSDNPLIIHIASPEDAEKYTFTNEMYYKLAASFMPGPLTVVLKAKSSVALETRAGLDTVAVRCPVNSVAHELIRLSGVPIAAPSANLSGSPSPTCASHVISDMNGRVDMIIDGGESEIGLESTIVKIEDDGALTLLRPGGITVEELKDICPNIKIADAVLAALKEGEAVLSPGMKYKHYAPTAPMYLIDAADDKRFEYVKNERKNAAAICFLDEMEKYSEILPKESVFCIGERNDLKSQAHLLFSVLRNTDRGHFDLIYAPMPIKEGIGLALYNRMIRAAAHRIIKL